jgi:hypothetical protein
MSFDATREEIELVCAYLKDDRAVANYFGIDRRRVAHIRAAMKDSIDNRRIASSRHEPAAAGSGEVQHRIWEEEAAVGSQQLNDRIHKLFRRWERRHGFQEGAAKILLPAGYSPARQMEAA